MQPTPPSSQPERPSGGDPYQAYRRLSRPSRSTRTTIDRTVRLLLGLGITAAALWLVWYFSNLVIYLIVGVLLSYLMRPVVDRMQGLGLGRIPAILVTFVVVFGALTVLLTELVPFAARQISDLSAKIALERAGLVVGVEGAGQTERPLLDEGELIIAVDGERWTGYGTLQSAVQARRPGEQVVLLVEDENGLHRYVPLTIRPVDEPADAAAGMARDPAPLRLETLGLTVQEVQVSEVASAIERRLRGIVPVEPGAIVRAISAALDELFQEERFAQFAGSVVGIFTDIFYAVLVIPFVAFFGLKDGVRIRHGLLRLVPNRYFEIALAIVEKIEAIIGRYFKALLVQCVVVGTVASTLLYVVGLDYALAVGIFTGLANTIPYFGPLMGFLVGTVVGIVQTGDFSLVPGILVAMALTQVTDNVFFQPFLFSRAAQTHPLIILFVVLMGAQVAGLVGMLVAIPLATIVRIVVEQVLWSLRNYRILQNA